MNIYEGTIDEAFNIQNLIPEFADSYPKEEYHKRLVHKAHHILIASLNEKPAGFKVGYALDENVFYSWMGGVLPDYRQMKVAKQLALIQEKWARHNGFQTIRFKTRNYLKPMLCFGLKNGFDIVEVETKNYPPLEYRIILEKRL